MIVGLYGVSLCLLMPSVLCIDGFGELGELGEYSCKLNAPLKRNDLGMTVEMTDISYFVEFVS